MVNNKCGKTEHIYVAYSFHIHHISSSYKQNRGLELLPTLLLFAFLVWFALWTKWVGGGQSAKFQHRSACRLGGRAPCRASGDFHGAFLLRLHCDFLGARCALSLKCSAEFSVVVAGELLPWSCCNGFGRARAGFKLGRGTCIDFGLQRTKEVELCQSASCSLVAPQKGDFDLLFFSSLSLSFHSLLYYHLFSTLYSLFFSFTLLSTLYSFIFTIFSFSVFFFWEFLTEVYTDVATICLRPLKDWKVYQGYGRWEVARD